MRRAGGFVWRWTARLIKLVAVVLSLAIVAVAVMAAITTQRGWAQTTGTIAIDGLNRPVTVLRDGSGIIHITAESTHDLFLAQGYVHAQERMWQMEISRRIGAGRLSELFGRGQVEQDHYIRTLGWRVAAERDLAAMSGASRAVLQSYADGVNAWIREHDGELSTPFVVAGLLSGTGGVGGFRLEPWTPLDTATWQKVQAWSLGGNVDTEIFRLLADQRLGDPARTDELFPPDAPTAPVITPSDRIGAGPGSGTEGAASAASPVLANAGLTADHAAALGDLARLGTTVSALAGFDRSEGGVGSHGVGSNNWVISGEHTESGAPILANDPHLGLAMPSVWIINGLHCATVSPSCPWDVAGVTFPGAPAVILGHNARIAWGATNVGPDTQDLFLETPDPADPDGHYLFEGRSVAYETRHETIQVAGGAAVEVDIRSTVHGPVLSDVDGRLADGPILAMRWTTTAEPDLTLETFFDINTAGDFDAFRAAFRRYGSPSQNFIYADVDGHIGYVLPGLIPIRAGPNGDRVRVGQSGDEEWTGYVPREELPWQLDPAAGRIISANNAPVDGSFPYWLGSDWDPGDRATRIGQRLDELPAGATIDDVRAVQLDDTVLRANQVVPRLEAIGPEPSTADGQLLWERLRAWDRRCDTGSQGCAAYLSIEMAVQRAIFDDELGPLARDYVGSPPSWKALVRLLGQPISPWWTITAEGSPIVDPSALTGGAIDATAQQLRESLGDPSNWTWGELHEVTFEESTLGSSGILPLEWYFNPPGRAVPGADGAVNNNYYQVRSAYPDPDDPDAAVAAIDEVFDVTNGPSLRFVIDMGDLDGARIVISTGQSGNPFDRHYGDMIGTWAAGETVAFPFSRVNVAASAVETLTLTPD